MRRGVAAEAGRAPTPSSGANERRLLTYLGVNLFAIWGSVAALVVLRLVIGDSRTLAGDIAALACGGILVLVARELAVRGRTAAAGGR